MKKTKDTNTEIKILEAAKSIFQRKGMAAARMQEIADEAGINKSMLHYYFRSKELLFSAVFIGAFKSLAPQLNDILNSNDTVFDKIKKFSNNHITFLASHPYLPSFILQEMNGDEAFVENLLSEIKFPSIKKFKQQVEQEVEDGNLKPITAEQLFINIIALNIFPFVAKPLLKKILNTSNSKYQQLIKERKTEVSAFIINSIKK